MTNAKGGKISWKRTFTMDSIPQYRIFSFGGTDSERNRCGQHRKQDYPTKPFEE